MPQADVIAAYEDILRVTGSMLAAARNSEWDRLIALETECRSLIERLQPRDPAAPLSEPHRRRKVEIIHRILANDAEIREHLDPWMAKLQHYLGNAARSRQLRVAYGDGR